MGRIRRQVRASNTYIHTYIHTFIIYTFITIHSRMHTDTHTYIHTYIHTYMSGMNSFTQLFVCVHILRSFLRMGSPAEYGPVQYHFRIDQGSYLVLVQSALVTAATAHLSREKGIFVSSMVLEVFTRRIHIHVCMYVCIMYIFMYF